MSEQEKNDLNYNCSWTDKDLSFLYHARKDGIPYKIIASELHRTVRACERKYQVTQWHNTPLYNPLNEKVAIDLRTAEHERLTKSQDRKLNVYKLRADILGDRIANAIHALPTVNPPRILKSKKKTDFEHVGLMFSDLHIGHQHSLEETGGITEYNHEIFLRRSKNLMLATKEIYDLHSKLYRLPELHIFCLGDIVAGMNNVGQWSNTFINLPIMDQMIAGWAEITKMINYWLHFFEKIHFYGIRGNHGRCSVTGYEKDYVNWDILCYKFLEQSFKNNPRVEFTCPNTWWILANVQNHKFLLVHGDDIKSGMPLKSLVDFEQKMTGIIKVIPNYTLAGHFHSCGEITTNNGRILLNGSFISGDVYAIKDVHANSRPEQKIFGIHERQGITWTYNIHLDSNRTDPDTSQAVSIKEPALDLSK